jgi:hypothetical protein
MVYWVLCFTRRTSFSCFTLPTPLGSGAGLAAFLVTDWSNRTCKARTHASGVGVYSRETVGRCLGLLIRPQQTPITQALYVALGINAVAVPVALGLWQRTALFTFSEPLG